MARENQGLQIALIVFVMLTIILAVTTFIFYKQYAEADERATTNQAEVSRLNTANTSIQQENNQLKGLMGFQATMTVNKGPNEDPNNPQSIQSIRGQFELDMLTYAVGFDESEHFYSPMMKQLYDSIQKKNADLAGEKQKLAALQTRYEQREATQAPQIKQHQDAATAASNDLLAERTKFESDWKGINATLVSVQNALKKANDDSKAGVDAVETQLKDAIAERDRLEDEYGVMATKLEEVSKETFELPDGEVVYVAQQTGTVWINLGRADALGTQTTFSVYPVDVTNLTGVGKKASIEVTEILDDHMAKARLVDYDIADPVMPGDKVHTPVWSPGERKRFALDGFMDINGDSKDDHQLVRRLIEASGGVVDCHVDENGNKAGEITVSTRYLVKGEPPEVTNQPNLQAAELKRRLEVYISISKEAAQKGLQEISVGDLLKKMGWRNQARVVRFGADANPSDLRPESSRAVSRFRPRRPPTGRTSARGGAY